MTEDIRASHKNHASRLSSGISAARHSMTRYVRHAYTSICGIGDDLKRGFERSALWMHTTAAIFAFTTDVLRPLFHDCTLMASVTAGIAFVGLVLATRKGLLRRETGTVFAVFCLMTALLSTTVLAAEKVSGDAPEGVFAHFSPMIRNVQTLLKIVIPQNSTLIGQNALLIPQNREIMAENEALIRMREQDERRPSIIVEHISGEWGDGDCSHVSYRIALTDGAIMVESGKRPEHAHSWKLIGTITAVGPQFLEVRIASPANESGYANTFTYERSGGIEHLIWKDYRSGSPPVELNRCR